jgi:serine/threonine-protein kinase
MQTIAIGRRPEPATSRTVSVPQHRRQTAPAVIRSSSETSIWDNPLAVLGIGLGLATVTGVAAWAIVSAVLNSSQPTPINSPTPTPIVSPTTTPTATPTATPSPIEYSQRLDLPETGELRVLQGHLKANETVVYVISAKQNQTFSAALEGEGVLLTVLAPDQKPAGDRSDRVLAWQGILPFTGDYAVRLSPVRGIAESDFKLNLSLQAPPEPSPSLSPSPSPSPTEPTIESSPLPLSLGEPLIVPGRADETVIKRYLVNVEPGQILSAAILDGTAVTLNIRYPNGQLVENASMINNWQAQITEPGEYQIDVIAPQVTNFTLRILVKEPPDQAGSGN